MAAFLEAINLRKTFLDPTRTAMLALDGVSLTVAEGEFLAIIGPSGCGKSTLLRLLAGLERPISGQVRLRGQPLTAPRREIGFVFQRATLMPWRTVLDNIMLPLEINHTDREQALAKAREWVTLVGLDGFADAYPAQLSGGMQQRVALARALIHEPSLLLLDEPFGALDAFTREELWCTLRDLHAAQRFNVILVTHDLRESVFLADTVYVMSKGPGRMLARREIDLPRPRDLEITYAPAFVEIVHELRGHIGAQRQGAAGGAATGGVA